MVGLEKSSKAFTSGVSAHAGCTPRRDLSFAEVWAPIKRLDGLGPATHPGFMTAQASSSPVVSLQPVARCASSVPAARWALAALSLAMLLASLGTSIANVALPTIARAFDASFPEVQWIVLAYLLSSTTLIVSVGRLGDMFGRRRLLLAGIGVFAAASVVCSVAPSLGVLIAARAVQGLGAALMMALSMALVGETVPQRKIGSAIGLLGTMSAIGTALGPSLGGLLIDGLGWPAIFLASVPLGLLAFALTYRHVPRDRVVTSRELARFDGLGTLLLAGTLGAYALAMTIGRGSFGALNVGLLGVAGVGIGVFGRVESIATSPVIRLAVLRTPGLRGSLATSALVSTVMMATLVVGPFYLARGLSLDGVAVGLVLSTGPLFAALTGVPAGRIADSIGTRPTTIIGLVAMAAGCGSLVLMPGAAGLPGYVAAIAVTTIGYALVQTSNNTAVMADVVADQRGVISGLLNLSRNLGLITGASLMGAVFAAASATSDIATAHPHAVTTGMRVTFGVATLLIAIALAVAARSQCRATRQVVSGSES